MFQSLRRTGEAFLSILIILASTAPASAVENIRLSHTISALGNDVQELYEFATTIHEVQLTPDGTRVLYLADDDYDGVQELYSVRADGTEDPIKLHTTLAPPHDSTADVVAFKITSDGATVVYGVGHGNGVKYDLWTTATDGTGTPAPLLPIDMFPTPAIANYLLTSDGSQVVFNAYDDDDSRWALFSAPLDRSSPPVKLSLDPVEMAIRAPVDQLLISPNNEWVVYVSNGAVVSNVGIYSAKIGVAGSEKFLNENPAHSSGAAGPLDATITADSNRVLYRGKNFTSRKDLISVPIDGTGTIERISAPNGTDVQRFVVSDDPYCNQVLYQVYKAGRFVLWTIAADGSGTRDKVRENLEAPRFTFAPTGCAFVFIDGDELFSSSPGGSLTLLAEAWYDVSSFAIHPDGLHVTFLADLDTQGVDELYTLPIAGGTPVRIHQPRTDGNRAFQIDSYQVITNLSGAPFVLFAGTGINDDTLRLFSAPATPELPGGTEAELSGSITIGGGVETVIGHTLYSPELDRVLFTSDRRIDEVIELFSVPLAGDTPIVINRGYAPVGDVDEVWASPDSEWVVYRGDFDWDNRFDLYLVPSKRDVHPIRINEIADRTSMFSTGQQVEFNTDSSLVVFLGPSANSHFMKLFVHEIATATTTQLSPDQADVAGNSDVVALRLHPDGESVVFLADHDDHNNPELYSVRFDTPKFPTKLIPNFPETAEIREDFLITPDGLSVLFSGDIQINGQYELFRYDFTDDSVTELSDMPSNGNDVTENGFALVLNDQSVLFLAERDLPSKEELFIVPLDNSSFPEKVSGTLTSGGDVSNDFVVTPDGNTVIFQADANRDEQHELFSVDLTAPSPSRITLNTGYPSGAGGVEEFRISPGGTRVAFRSQDERVGNIKLFLATIGQTGSQILVSPAGPHDDVDVTDDFAFTPNEEWIFFRADALNDEQFSVFKYRLSDSLGILAHVGMSAEETVDSFRITEDGYRFIYRVAETSGERVKLYSAYTETIDIPTRMDKGNGTYTDILSPITLLPDSSQVIFLDDRRKDDTYELHTAFELPTISEIQNQFVEVDNILRHLVFSVDDLETRPTEIIVSAASSNQTLIPDGNIVITGSGTSRQITITPAPGQFGGPTTITVSVTAKRETVTMEFDVMIGLAPPEYRRWLDGYFAANELDDPTKEISRWGLLADPDGDKLPNIAEWAKGLNPIVSDADSDHLTADRIDDVFAVQVRSAKPFPATLRLNLETSPDLAPGSWSPIPFPWNLSQSVVQDLGIAEIIEYRYQLSAPEPDILFLRFRYSAP